SALRDHLALGALEAAHMLSPVPVAMSLGLGGLPTRIDALMVLSVNGNVVGVSPELAQRMREQGWPGGFGDPAATGGALIAATGRRLRVGVPFPFSMHAELLYHWLGALGMRTPDELDVRTVPPPLMAEAMAEGEIDAFCVGEPWGSITVDNGAGALLLPGRAIWSFAPEKVLAVRTKWVDDEPELTARLMRAVWKAGRWLAEGGAQTTAAEVLARNAYLDLPTEIIDRALTGRLVISPKGDVRDCPGFIEFFDGAATFPWKSQAIWIASQMAARLGLDRAAAMQAARTVFRTEIYRRTLREAGAILPGASEKIEGGIAAGTAVASETGRLILAQNRFFDGQIFDPVTEY
ncbi:MAG: CmpA/NrtA family ABC transporter substrate-binding protein, partial [Pseudomonadota bacterium]